ncbi:hypothetical protein [Sphingobium lactosutens]|uniref:Uncharacterized protein n=1 Tax=Sphingobium lactosutens DS20 TaxID=1331060 RepID=T0J1B2_9SPHN|nr:hypothetical protein [Sphingobium lactosutens]EQB15734.1 hypothetical protein RLDS_10690 [Sphingobium lactosutens DS20]
MSKQSVTSIADAAAVADWLDQQGEHKRANDVRRICRSNVSLRNTCSLLYKDNMALRETRK